VDRFYDFWTGFKSWRDFSSEGEHDVEMAKNRWERRAMQKENEKAARVRKREEAERIQTLVELARRHDPRLRRREAKKARARAPAICTPGVRGAPQSAARAELGLPRALGARAGEFPAAVTGYIFYFRCGASLPDGSRQTRPSPRAQEEERDLAHKKKEAQAAREAKLAEEARAREKVEQARAAEAAAAAKSEKQNAKFLARQERKEFRKLCEGVDGKLVDQAACPPPARARPGCRPHTSADALLRRRAAPP
jgi:hypothetical protein